MAVKSAHNRGRTAANRSARRPPWVKWVKVGLYVSLIVLLATGIFVGFFFYPRYVWAQGQVAKLDTLTAADIAVPTEILSADGKLIYRSITKFQEPVKYPDIPQVVIDATLAAEDERFFQHPGVDFRSAIRAVLFNVREGRTAQGASTITMQLAKRMFTTDDKNFDRKVKDVALALAIEGTKTKEEILKLYLNNVFYGAGAYGISAAADVYFGKELDELTVAEAALLARLVQRPSVDNPYRNPERAVEKRNVVLAKMRELGSISGEEYEKAVGEPLRLRKDFIRAGERILSAPFYVNYILDTIRKTHPEIDVSKGGYRIETTIDVTLQRYAEGAVKKVVAANRKAGVTTGAFVCMDSEGRILAMVGGADFSKNQYNAISQGRRQPGSSFKPFVYAAALSTGALGFRESISNEPHYIDLPDGSRKLWPKGGGKGGSVSIRTALAMSINVPAVRVMEKVSPETAVNYANSVFGFTSPLDPVPSLVLGASAVSPLEMAQAYSVFMLGGNRATPFGIKRIVCPDGRIIDDFGPRVIEGLLDPQVAAYMDDCLRAVVRSGTATRAAGVPNARGKTGTTQDNRDAWFCGYTNNLVGIGWVANEHIVNGKPEYRVMPGVFGGRVTVNIWAEFMKKALERFDDSESHNRAELPAPTVEADSERLPPEVVPESDPPIEVPDPLPDNRPPQREPPVGGDGATGAGGETSPRPPSGRPRQSPPDEGLYLVDEIPVEICVESGQRASPYCPETVTRRMLRGAVPRRCRLHGPHRSR